MVVIAELVNNQNDRQKSGAHRRRFPETQLKRTQGFYSHY